MVYLYSAFQQQCYKVPLKISICSTRKGNNQQNVIKSDASQEAVLNVVSHDGNECSCPKKCYILYRYSIDIYSSQRVNAQKYIKVIFHQKNVGLMPDLLIDCNSFREYGFFYSLIETRVLNDHLSIRHHHLWSLCSLILLWMPCYLMQCVLDPLGGDEAGIPGGRLCVLCHRPLQPICQHCRWSALASQLHKIQSGRFKASAGPCRSDMAQHSSQWDLVSATRSS